MFRKTNTAIIIAVLAFVVTATAASAAEIRLGGITLGRSALSIIKQYGNPSEVRLGQRAQAAVQPGFGGAGGEMPPGGMPGFGGEAPPPGMSMEAPPAFGAPGVAAQPSQGGGGAREVTWIYRFAKNKTLEFIIDPEGRVLQIAAFGVEWPGMKTARGITLGASYKQIILTYGFPESHERSGIEMVLKYANSDRVAFTLVGQQVVGITIAFMD